MGIYKIFNQRITMKKYLIILSIPFLAFLQGCGKQNEKSLSDVDSAINVTVGIASSNSDSSFFTASGKIKSEYSADLSTRLMGFVNKVHVNVGDQVTKGQLLLSINNSDLQAQLAQVNASVAKAVAGYTIAEKDYKRFINLYEENSVSQKEMDDMKSNYEMAKAGLEAAEQMKKEIESQFAYSDIRAPFSGVITNRFIETGDLANPGIPLISIESPGNFEVDARVPESEIMNIKKDQEVSVTVKSINKVIPGKVSEVSSSSRNTGGQFLVKIRLLETDPMLLSGMYASIDFPIEKTTKDPGLILIMKDAVIQRGQLSGVYTVKDQKTAILRWLRLGKTYGDKIEVLSGLSADEEYIISAEGKLFNGATVSVK
jgi:RND family efflux transporter MFP subunit